MLEFKFEFLQVVCNHEHYIPLNLPLDVRSMLTLSLTIVYYLLFVDILPQLIVICPPHKTQRFKYTVTHLFLLYKR